jgi:uncharacterized protein (TIGR03382 family)
VTALVFALLFETGGQFDVCTQPVCTTAPNGFVNANTSQGLVFTGAPRDVARTCEVCHTNAPRRIGLRIESDDPSLFTVGWQPSRTYHMRVVMTGEWAGTQYTVNDQNCGNPNDPGGYKPCNDNGFTLEIDDGTGHPITATDGKFQYFTDGQCSDMRNAETYIMADGSAIAHGVTHARTIWDFCWVAPQQDHGPLVLYVAAVDGSGGDGTADNVNDTVGDDVFAGSVPLPEQGMGTLVPQNGGCSAAGSGAAGGGILLVVVFALVFRRARILALLALLAGGCTTVRPWQKEQLARRIMKFAPDPDEDELDLHMLEAREGSTGGYGSAGGGCGCN